MKMLLLLVLAVSGQWVGSAYSYQIYRLFIRPKSWAKARQICREKFYDLATVQSKDDNDKLFGVFEDKGQVVWIGLYQGMFVYKWTQDNVNNGFTNWDVGEPTIYQGKSCMWMSSTGMWNDGICHKQKPFVCYNEKGPSKYILIKIQMNWFKARKYCMTNYTNLVTVSNRTENELIAAILPEGERVWMGLRMKYWEYWSDQTLAGFYNWNVSQPKYLKGVKHCAAVNTTTGKWLALDCEEKIGFICQLTPIHQQKLKLEFRSDVDPNDPAVQQQILAQLHAKLENHGLSDFKLRWMKTDGQIFHKQEKEEEKDASSC